MPGTQFKLDMTITNAAFPALTHDSILPAVGAAVLIDPTHPYEPWGDGVVPAAGWTAPNLAAEQMAAMTGSTLAAAKPTVYVTGAADGATIIRARTPKGGLRTKGSYTGLRHPEALLNFMIANPTHSWYVSNFSKFIDVPAAASLQTGSLRDGNNNYIYAQGVHTGTNTPQTGNARFLGSYASGPGNNTTAGMTHTALGVVGAAFAAGATGASLLAGNQASLLGTYANSGTWDRITYSMYLEDLTVSGRTFAQVLELDKARYAKLFAPGGRYYGDTNS